MSSPESGNYSSSEYPAAFIEKAGQLFNFHETCSISAVFAPESPAGQSVAFKRAFITELIARNILTLEPQLADSLPGSFDGHLLLYSRQDIPHEDIFALEELLWDDIQPFAGDPATIRQRLAGHLAFLEQQQAASPNETL